MGPPGRAEGGLPGAEPAVQGGPLLPVHPPAEEPGGPAGPQPAQRHDSGHR